MKIDAYDLLKASANDFAGHNIAVLGVRGYGKSNTAAVLIEEWLTAGMPVTVVDPHGEYHGLCVEHDIHWVGRHVHKQVDTALNPSSGNKLGARVASVGNQSVILDVSGYYPDEREEFLTGYFAGLLRVARSRSQGIPHMIILEESRHFVPQRGKLTPLQKDMKTYAFDGRKWGFGLVYVSQRASTINKDMLTQCSWYFLHKVKHKLDLSVYTDLIPRPPAKVKLLVSKLTPGDCLVLDPQDRVIQHRIRKRTTPHYGHTPTLEAVPADGQLSFDGLLQE